MAETWDEENWFDLVDYSNLDMDACIRAMEENGMLSSSSSAGSLVAKIDEINRMDGDTSPPTMALSEEPLVSTSSECSNTSASPVDLTGRGGNGSPALQSEGSCTLDIIMDNQYLHHRRTREPNGGNARGGAWRRRRVAALAPWPRWAEDREEAVGSRGGRDGS